MGTAAVIGNGAGMLKEERLGGLIDSFDAVVRVNWYRIRGYEEFVGSRIDYWVTDLRPVKHGPPENLDQIKEVWIYPFYEFSPETHQGHIKFCPDTEIVSNKKFYMWTYGFIPGKRWPSNGFGALMYTLTRLKPSKLLLAGFDSLLDPTVAYTYYYGKIGVSSREGTGFDIAHSNHSLKDENRAFTEFTQDGYREEWRRNGCQLLISQS